MIDEFWVRAAVRPDQISSDAAISEIEFAVSRLLPFDCANGDKDREALKKVKTVARIVLGPRRSRNGRCRSEPSAASCLIRVAPRKERQRLQEARARDQDHAGKLAAAEGFTGKQCRRDHANHDFRHVQEAGNTRIEEFRPP